MGAGHESAVSQHGGAIFMVHTRINLSLKFMYCLTLPIKLLDVTLPLIIAVFYAQYCRFLCSTLPFFMYNIAVLYAQHCLYLCTTLACLMHNNAILYAQHCHSLCTTLPFFMHNIAVIYAQHCRYLCATLACLMHNKIAVLISKHCRS